MNNKSSNEKDSIFIFTSLYGDYEELNELNFAPEEGVSYVCFTDNSKLVSKTWEIKLLSLHDFIDPVRRSRYVKMFGHRHFPNETKSLYIDNSVQLKICGSKILDVWLQDCDVAMMEHSTRRSLWLEFLVCSMYGLDSQDLIYRQYQYYKSNNVEILLKKPLWGGMIARKYTQQVDQFMVEWSRQYQEFTRRDQLSINVAVENSRIDLAILRGNIKDTEWHKWPISVNRKNIVRDGIRWRRFRKLIYLYRFLRYSWRYVPWSLHA